MKYKLKPVVIEAFQWTGDEHQGGEPEWIVEAIKSNSVYFQHQMDVGPIMRISTLEGTMTAQLGDFIIQGINKEIYPCKPDIFEKTYEPVNPVGYVDPYVYQGSLEG